MKNPVIFIIAFLFVSSCATLNVSEVKNLDKQKFEPLNLKPDVDVDQVRIDIIRHKVEYYYVDTEPNSLENSLTRDSLFVNTKTKKSNVPYHPMGFKLGNALFYDLNGNLCLRIDELFGVEDTSFVLEKIKYPKRNKGIYKRKVENDTVSTSEPLSRKYSYRFHRVYVGDTLKVQRKNRIKYYVVNHDSTLTYIKGLTKKVIHKIDNEHYYVNRNNKFNQFVLEDNEIRIQKIYLVRETDDGKTIEILKYRKKRPYVLYWIEKGDNKIFIYDRFYSGKKLEMRGDTLNLYANKYLYYRFVVHRNTENTVEK
ncbi:MAG: hypothetical protein GXO47_02945 [Chlorobi bacterium]|nr:hypothetical protein [Chlorobiota bacterium]